MQLAKFSIKRRVTITMIYIIVVGFGLFSLSAVAARPVVGWLVDRWGRKPVLLAGAAIFGLSPVLYVIATTPLSFQLVRILHGVGISALTLE